jgi:hypothetical protein
MESNQDKHIQPQEEVYGRCNYVENGTVCVCQHYSAPPEDSKFKSCDCCMHHIGMHSKFLVSNKRDKNGEQFLCYFDCANGKVASAMPRTGISKSYCIFTFYISFLASSSSASASSSSSSSFSSSTKPSFSSSSTSNGGATLEKPSVRRGSELTNAFKSYHKEKNPKPNQVERGEARSHRTVGNGKKGKSDPLPDTETNCTQMIKRDVCFLLGSDAEVPRTASAVANAVGLGLIIYDVEFTDEKQIVSSTLASLNEYIEAGSDFTFLQPNGAESVYCKLNMPSMRVIQNLAPKTNAAKMGKLLLIRVWDIVHCMQCECLKRNEQVHEL